MAGTQRYDSLAVAKKLLGEKLSILVEALSDGAVTIEAADKIEIEVVDEKLATLRFNMTVTRPDGKRASRSHAEHVTVPRPEAMLSVLCGSMTREDVNEMCMLAAEEAEGRYWKTNERYKKDRDAFSEADFRDFITVNRKAAEVAVALAIKGAHDKDGQSLLATIAQRIARENGPGEDTYQERI